MVVSRIVIAAVVATIAGAMSVSAQGCSGSATCSATNTASVTVGALVDLGMSSATTTLTAPTVGDLGGSVADVGPTFVIKANQGWTMSIKTTNATNWTYAGANSGVKAIGDLSWSTDEATYTALTASNVTVANDAASTNATDVSIFFKTAYAASFADAGNRSGVYSLPVVFTLSAP